MMPLANYLTIIRVLISPIFLVVYLQHDSLGIGQHMLPFALLFLLIISELTDAFDGFIARKYDQVTDFGKILDPMADSVSRLSLFLTFTQDPVALPMLLVFVFIYRDALTCTLRIICALKGFALAARLTGKIKAVLQAIALFIILFLMIGYSQQMLTLEQLQRYSFWVVAVTAFYTFLSCFDYVYANRVFLSQIWRRTPKTLS